MAWEQRGGHWYYYQKERRGAQVVSLYRGRGEVAELAACLDEIIRGYRRRATPSPELIRASAAVAEAHDRTQALARAALVASGYHRPKGEWRKQRGKANHNDERRHSEP